MGRQGAPWGRLARHQATLSTSAHAEYEHDQGRVTPCYPDERCFLAWFGKSLWNFQIAFFGQSCAQPTKVAQACWGGVPGRKRGWFSPTFGLRRDKGVSGRSPFPGEGRGLSTVK